METARKCVFLGSVFGFLAVALGAFGAHALKSVLDANQMRAVYETAVQYQMAHALALLLLGALAERVIPATAANRVCMLFTFGIVVFSGSLYVLSVSNIKLLGAITPFGGLAFMVGWVMIAMGVRSGDAK